jgi:hypothetical protein
MLSRTLALFASLLLFSLPSSAQSPRQADLALVLAVDVSGSVSNERFHLQREGIAQALEWVSQQAEHETIELAILEWSSKNTTIVPWTTLTSPGDFAAIAGILRTAPRAEASLTDVGLGISASLDLLDALPLPADRMIIDVSGDGTQNTGELTAQQVRDLAVKKGITVNGLPITDGGDANLKEWYRDNVMGGDQAFIIVANGFDDFARAMRQKLTLEIAAASRLTGIADAAIVVRAAVEHPRDVARLHEVVPRPLPREDVALGIEIEQVLETGLTEHGYEQGNAHPLVSDERAESACRAPTTARQLVAVH